MNVDSGLKLEKLLVDGGMARNGLMMQMQADLLGEFEFPNFVQQFFGMSNFYVRASCSFISSESAKNQYETGKVSNLVFLLRNFREILFLKKPFYL